MFGQGIIKLIVIPLLIILELTLLLANRKSEANAPLPQKAAAVPVEVTHVKKRDMNTFLLFNCTIEAERQVDVVAKTSGEVKEIFVEEGQQAAEGQALARLDDTESLLTLKEAKIKYENARLIYERSKRTYEEKITSKEQLDESRMQYETALVDYERKNLEYTYNTITSPMAGIVVSRVIEVGSVVQKNQKVFTVADFNPLLARIRVPEKDLNKIKEGQIALITIESIPGLQSKGRIKMINPVVDPESGTTKVTVEIEYTEGSPLRPGMFASVYAITERHANALTIPKKALLFESEGAEVFVVKNFAMLSLTKQEAEKFAVGDYVKLSLGLKSKPAVSKKDDITPQPAGSNEKRYVNGIVSEKQAASGIAVELLEGSNIPIEVTGSHIDIAKVESGDTLKVQNDAFHLETRAHKAKVKLGFSEGNEVEVVSGLNEDDVIVTVGQEDLGHGAVVMVVAGTEANETPVGKIETSVSLKNK